MTKRRRGFGTGVSLGIRIAIPLLAAAIAAACGSNGGSGGSGGGKTGGSSSVSAGAGNPQGSGAGAGSSSGNGGGAVTSSSGMGGGAQKPCTGDGDCANNPGHTVCDTTTGNCVGCLPGNDTCPAGEFCDPTKNSCAMGCKDKSDCSGMTAACDPATHTCVECVVDDDCALGSLCFSGSCSPGCTAAHGCAGTDSCCNGICADTQTSVFNCGMCGKACPVPDHAPATCAGGMCGMGACDMAWANCDGQSNNGCEWNVLLDGPCTCKPGATQPCYNGAPGTQNNAPCHGGTQTCNAQGTGWGACVGEVLPQPELCANNIDEDCDGTKDNVPDIDGDGWTACNGDCCETVAQCATPALVNPGAYEVLNNNQNDDCDAATSDSVAPAACSTLAKFSGVTAGDIAAALDICQTTTANAPLPTKKWGLLTASQLLANGAAPNATDLGNIQNWQNAVLVNYGNTIGPKKGPTMAGLSTGKMRDAGDPGFVVPVTGTDFLRTLAFAGAAAPLGTYLGQHGGGLVPGSCAGSTCVVGTGANDSLDVRLQIRVPTNAKSFSYDFRFFTGEYQVYQCTLYNDYYLAMLTSGAAGIPADHQISFDAQNHPVSVNNGFFQVCGGNGKNCGACPNGTAELAGTGMDQVSGGGTAWLTTDAPVVPGETMMLELVLFDVQDDIYDSVIIADNFRWNLATAVVSTHQ